MKTQEDLLSALLDAAKKAGADQADAMLVEATSLSTTIRQGRLEDTEHAQTVKLGLRVFSGQRVANVSSTVTKRESFARLASQAVTMARALPENPHAGLASSSIKGQLSAQEMRLADPSSDVTIARLQEASRIAEESALAGDGITKSNGASASSWRARTSLADTDGFMAQSDETIFGASVSVIAGQGDHMQRDYASHVTRHWRDLDPPATLGQDAANRAKNRLNPRKPRTGRMAAVFDPRVSGSLLGHLAAALNGMAVARGTSFLAASRGRQVLPAGLHVIDDPTRPAGLASRLFDGEGVRPRCLSLIEDGRLENWLLDQTSASHLNLPNNGCARRAPGGVPAPTSSNLYLSGGRGSPEDLIADIAEGVYITEMIGSTINMLTGDYSRGASGFMIRNGKIAEPVAGMTVAGQLSHMFLNICAADDLTFRRSINAPTLRINDMTIAGE